MTFSRFFTLLFCCIGSLPLFSQLGSWEALAPMPEPVANNAVTMAEVDGVPYVFSFAGIDTTKIWSGIHSKAFAYNTQTDEWMTLPDLPAGNGRIAAGASTVKGKIYIIGGYEVFPNGNEASFDEVHVFDPQTMTYEADATSIPIPIDDHVQAVWQDSLIFVITGWSNNGNVPNVQIYNPTTDEWSVGTSTPNSNNYKVFGGSGVIINNTIYYMGGAIGTFAGGMLFPPSKYIRSGAINPDNPTEIVWTGYMDDTALGYRMGAATYGPLPVWLGGSLLTYNYDGVDYNGTGNVPAQDRLVVYQNVPEWAFLHEAVDTDILPPTMDLRGVAELPGNTYIIAGGMDENTEVTDRTTLITLDVVINDVAEPSVDSSIDWSLHPNPASDFIAIDLEEEAVLVELFDLQGVRLIQQLLPKGRSTWSLTHLPTGIYSLSLKKRESCWEAKH
jgi:hypothetical protein